MVIELPFDRFERNALHHTCSNYQSGFCRIAVIIDASAADQLHAVTEKIWFIGGGDGAPYIANGHWTP
jgi:hypothetical protein